MTKKEMIEILVKIYHESEEEMKKLKKEDLKSLLEDFGDGSNMFPNGRDYDSENWDD